MPALLGLAAWLLLSIALRPLALPDEGRHAEVAREMPIGSAGVPTLQGLPDLHELPLTDGVETAAMQLLGVDAGVVRVAPALGAWLMGAALHLELQRGADSRFAALALAVLASCPFYFVASKP